LEISLKGGLGLLFQFPKNILYIIDMLDFFLTEFSIYKKIIVNQSFIKKILYYKKIYLKIIYKLKSFNMIFD